MRYGALIVLAIWLPACDRLWGLDTVNIADAASDTTAAPQISDLAIVEPVAVLEHARVTAKVHGAPNQTLVCMFAATAGGFFPAEVLALLDDNGDAWITAMYVAPGTPGDVKIQGMIGASSTSLMFTVRPLITVGNDSMLAGTSVVVGTRIQLAAPATVKYAGVWVTGLSSTTMVQLALYSDAGGPNQLVADLGVGALVTGRNVYPTNPVHLATGTYWLLGEFDQDLFLFSGSSATLDGFVSGSATPFGSAPPTDAPNGTFYLVKYAYFISVAQ